MGSPSLSTPLARLRAPQVWLGTLAALGAFVGGVAATRVSSGLVAGFFLVALVIAVFLWRSQDPLVPFLFLVAALQGGFLLQVSLGESPVSTLMPFLGGWTVLAVLMYGRRPSAVATDSLSGRLLPRSLVALAAIVTLTAVAQSWRPDGRLLSLTEILTIVQLAVLVLLASHLLTSPRRMMMMAHVTVVAGVLVALAALADRAGLISLGTDMAYGDQYTRVSGLMEDPNFFSFQLLVALSFAVHFATAAKSALARVLAWLAFGIIVAGIVSSYSAGALVGLGALVGTALVLQFKISAKRAMVAFLIMVIVAGAVALTAPAQYGEAVKQKFGSITDTSFEQLGTKRGAAWEAGAREVLHNPVLGTGFSSESEVVAIADYYKLDTTDRKAAHNMYIGMAVTTGVLGLLAFLLALGSSFRVLWSTHTRAAEVGDSETVLATACVFTALVVVAIQGVQLDTQFMKYTWLVLGACVGVQRWANPRPSGR